MKKENHGLGDNSLLRILELRSVWGTGGGPEKTIFAGAQQSDRARYAITVCYIRDERDQVFGPKVKAREALIDYVEVREKNSFNFSVWKQLVDICVSRDIQIVHSHDYKTNLLAWLLYRFKKIIPLTTSHGWTGNSGREKFYYWGDKKLVARFPLVIAVSSQIKAELVCHGSDPAKVRVILNGIDPGKFRRDKTREREWRAALGLPLDKVIIGGVGRLERQKRFDLLIEAFAAIHKSHPDTFLTIAGDGSLMNVLDEQIKALGLTDACKLLGHQNDIAMIHHAFDIYVQSSAYEGTPNAVLEAMALESPLVATAAGGTAELVRNNVDGLVIPIENVPALIEAISTVYADRPAALERVRSARARVENELSFAQRTRKLEEIYEELAARYTLG